METRTTIILIVAVLIVCIFLLFYINHIINKKRNKERIEKLDNWVKKAKTMGYNYIKMEGLLQFYGWENDLIKKALKENGMKPPVEE